MKTVLDVVTYLQSKGYKCGKSVVYNHVNSGKLSKKDGEFKARDVDKYAALNLKLESGPSPSVQGDIEELQRVRIESDARKSQAQAIHWEMKTGIMAGQLIDKELFYGEMSARAAILKSDFENFVRSYATNMANVVDGDLTKVPDLIELMLEQVEVFFGKYAQEKVWTVPAHTEEGEKHEAAG